MALECGRERIASRGTKTIALDAQPLEGLVLRDASRDLAASSGAEVIAVDGERFEGGAVRKCPTEARSAGSATNIIPADIEGPECFVAADGVPDELTALWPELIPLQVEVRQRAIACDCLAKCRRAHGAELVLRHVQPCEARVRFEGLGEAMRALEAKSNPIEAHVERRQARVGVQGSAKGDRTFDAQVVLRHVELLQARVPLECLAQRLATARSQATPPHRQAGEGGRLSLERLADRDAALRTNIIQRHVEVPHQRVLSNGCAKSLPSRQSQAVALHVEKCQRPIRAQTLGQDLSAFGSDRAARQYERSQMTRRCRNRTRERRERLCVQTVIARQVQSCARN